MVRYHLFYQMFSLSFFIVKCEYYEKTDTSPSITNKEDFISFENVPSPIACVQKCKYRKALTHYENGQCYCFTKEHNLKELETSYQIIEMPDQHIESSLGSHQSIMKNCAEWFQAGSITDGEYVIKPGDTAYTVFCDMNTDGGGWIKFQNRFDGSVNFTRNWNEYKIGFGNLSGEFWLGNEIIHQLTALGMKELRISASDFEDNERFAKFSNFALESEQFDYTLTYNGCVSGLCDALSNEKSQKFSTYDRDNDKLSDENCADKYFGGWWFRRCFKTNFNGQYRKAGEKFGWAYGIHWEIWRPHDYSLTTTEMMLR